MSISYHNHKYSKIFQIQLIKTKSWYKPNPNLYYTKAKPFMSVVADIYKIISFVATASECLSKEP